MEATHTTSAIGVDLGATKIAAGLVSNVGAILARRKTGTGSGEGPEAVADRLAGLISDLIQQAQHEDLPRPTGLGVGVAGLIDHDAGVVISSPNAGWSQMPLRDLVAARVPLTPVVVDNDGNCAAIGETWVGAAAGYRHVACLTLGTGVGGGLVLDGRIYRGAHGVGAEVGHLVVAADGELCSCGGRGCLEAYASGTAVARMARSRLESKPGTTSTLRGIRSDELRAEDVTEAAAAGDTLAREVLAEAGRMLGCGLTSLVHLLEPELVVVSGGLAEAGDMILAPARAELRRRAFPASVQHVKVLPAKLGNDAGMVGAAALVLANPD